MLVRSNQGAPAWLVLMMRSSEERNGMRAELEKGKKAHRAKSAPRGRPSADQVLAARTRLERAVG
eukprot:scaffold63326_cov36-Phaeocystis_antarctica.AAC.2